MKAKRAPRYFYTYTHARISDGLIFYVGKGQWRRAWSVQGRSEWWTRMKDKHGVSVSITAEWKTEAEAFEHEKLLIACFRDLGHPLVNLTTGGDGGYTLGPDARKKFSDAAKRRGMSDACREAARRANTGRRQNPELVAMRAEANRGRIRTEEQRARIARARSGLPRTAEAVEKTAAKLRGRKADPAAVRARADAIRGRPQTPEHIAKRVAAVAATKARAQERIRAEGLA